MRRLLLAIPLYLIIAVSNATAQDAEIIPANEAVIVEITDAEGVTLIYQASGAQTVSISARSLDTRLDTTLEIYDEAGGLLAFNDDAASMPEGFVATDSQIVNLGLAEAGSYTIRVKSFSAQSRGEVEVIVSSGGTATTIAVPEITGKALFTSEPLKVYLDAEAPVDLVYAAGAAETVSIYITSLPDNAGAVDSTLEVLDANGDQLAFNDDLTDATLNPGIEELTLPEAGLYTVRINTYEDSDPGGVEINIIGEGSAPIVNEGDTLTFDETLTVSISGEEMPSFIFEGESGQIITLRALATEPESPDQDLVIRLFGANGQALAEDDDSGVNIDLGERDPAIIEFELPEDGTYRVEVDSLFDVSGEFEITLTES